MSILELPKRNITYRYFENEVEIEKPYNFYYEMYGFSIITFEIISKTDKAMCFKINDKNQIKWIPLSQMRIITVKGEDKNIILYFVKDWLLKKIKK